MRGYVVRGKYNGEGRAAFNADGWTATPRAAAVFLAFSRAVVAQIAMEAGGCTDVRIFAVAEDGTETPLPSYEDAIGQRNAFRDHLAIADKRADALAAERDVLLTLLDRVDYDGKSLPGELRDDIGKALDAARRAGWRRE